MLTKGAIGNLVNRYRAVLKKCNLINTFGSLAVASMLVMGGAGVAGAEILDTHVAAIGNQGYATLEAAVAAANSGDTVTLLTNASGNGFNIKKDMTLDLDGHTYTVGGNAVGSSGTVSQGIRTLATWESGKGYVANDITIKNGIIVFASDSVQMGINNYSNLTLESVVLDGTDLAGVKYVLSNNHGSATIIGSELIAPEDGVAFDADRHSDYPKAAVVTVENSIITGKIDKADENAAIAIKSGSFSDNSALAFMASGASINMGNPNEDFVLEAEGNAGLASKYSVNINAKSIKISSKEYGINQIAGSHVLTADKIDITGNSGGAGIYVNGEHNGSVTINGFKDGLTIQNIASDSDDGYAIMNNGVGNTSLVKIDGTGDINILGSKRTAIASRGASAETIVKTSAGDITISSDIAEGYKGRKGSVIYSSDGKLDIEATAGNIIITEVKGDSAAIGLADGGSVNLKAGGDVTITGKIARADNDDSNGVKTGNGTFDIQSGGKVTITSAQGVALGSLVNGTINADSLSISSADNGAINQIAGSYDFTANKIDITGNSGGAGIYVNGEHNGSVTINGFKDGLTIQNIASDSDDGYAIMNNGASGSSVIKVEGTGDIDIIGSKRTALASNGSTAETLIKTAGNISINSAITQDYLDEFSRKSAVIYSAGGTTTLHAGKTLTIADNSGLEGNRAILIKDGELNLTAQNYVIKGDVIVGLPEVNTFALRATRTSSATPTLVFNGGSANIDGNLNAENGGVDLNDGAEVGLADGSNNTIGTLGGDGSLIINDENTTLNVTELADGSTAKAKATGELTDKLGGDAEKFKEQLSGEAGSQLYGGMEEGKVFGAVDETGKQSKNRRMEAVVNQASVTTVAIDKLLTNDVRKRLGDIRSDKNQTGVWMRWDGGKLQGDGLSNNFNTIQIGGDTKVGKNCRLGVAGSFTHGDADFASGFAQLEGFSFATYATWMAENGMFADVVARLGHFSNEMTIDGIKDDIDNRVFSLSGEYGWRFNVCDQFFVEPQVELAYTYVSSADLQLGDVKYELDNMDSLTGRLGLVAGWNLPDDRGNVYARASVLQQFMGDSKITGFTAAGIPNVQKTNGDDTWLEYGIGANVKLTDKTYIWADVERTEGATIEEEWRGTVGLRYNF